MEFWFAESITPRYLSQARQELAIRLVNRVYAGGPAPSKVGSVTDPVQIEADGFDLVVVKLYEEEVYG